MQKQKDALFTAPHHPSCPPLVFFTTEAVKTMGFQVSAASVPSPADGHLSVLAGSRKSDAAGMEALIFLCSPSGRVAQLGGREQQERSHLVAQSLLLTWRNHPPSRVGRQQWLLLTRQLVSGGATVLKVV